jgi:hypothetical protein
MFSAFACRGKHRCRGIERSILAIVPESTHRNEVLAGRLDAFTYGNVEYEPHRRAQLTIVIFSFEGRAGNSDDLKNVPIPVSETSRQKSISE